MSMVQVTVPEGVTPGQTIMVQTPNGPLNVQVPADAVPGSTFMVQAAAAAAAGEADEGDYEPYVPLEDKKWDVTDPCESLALCIGCPCIGWQTKVLVAQDQEVFFRTKNCLTTSKQRRPYAQLGSVDKHSSLCTHRLVSDFSPLNEKGEGGVAVGCCGCDEATLNDIVAELQERKRKRGGIGQIRKLDYVLDKAVRIAVQAPMLAEKMGVAVDKQPAPSAGKVVLERKEIDIANYCEKICCTRKMLQLTEEEAILDIQACGCCNHYTQKREYGEIGYVEKKKQCICCFSVSSNLSPIAGQGDFAPGCPCTNRTQVTKIVQELRHRMATRGQVGQIKKQERIMGLVSQIENTMFKIKDAKGVPFPPTPQEMNTRFGSNQLELGVPIVKEPLPDKKEYDVTGTWDSWLGCLFTCGIQGCTKETVELDGDYLIATTVNNLDDSNMKMPYAEMDNVDLKKSCCCCWSVFAGDNEYSPGCGCSGEQVKQLNEDLQERKVKRGNIAHLKQLRTMQANAVGLDILAEKLCETEGIACPPDQATMSQVWGQARPRGLAMGSEVVHIEPDKEFETKNYDVTNFPECCCIFFGTCGTACCTKTNLELGPDELTMVQENMCGRTSSRTPYGNLGSVETELNCCCCHSLPDVATPGCGCSKEMVDEIAQELQERKVMRGNIAQMKQQENIIKEVLQLEVKMDLLCHKSGVQYPPTPEVMATLFLPAVDEPHKIGAE